jgi:geranylgeranyl diphosphate synthase type II
MKEFLKSIANAVDERLHHLLEQCEMPKILRDAMCYSVFAGGKRLRPALNILANQLLNGDADETMDISCAIEMIHTYSLIHDDLPAMDNDTMRRGKATNHVVFGEAYAILAGDGLLNYAYEAMLQNSLRYKNNFQNHIRAIRIIANAAGPLNMIAGQACDIEFEGKMLSKTELELLHRRKTGAMITASLLSGIVLCSPTDYQINAVIAYGDRIGLVFQIIDDILDITGNEQNMGKTTGKDEKTEKLTYPKLYGMEASVKLALTLTTEAEDAIGCFGTNAEHLQKLAAYLLNRNS